MTIGQRIAQYRKALGLSQEALGEKLGVTRQSIYKWESDAALPEIEKLVTLSRLFGLSVGALLGVEEDAAPAPEENSELSEQQLKMVEEIVARYIEALPKEPPKKKRPVLRFLLAAALLFAAWKIYGKLEDVDRQYQNLTNQVSYVQRNVENQVQGISTRVENILKAQNALVADQETTIAATDLANGLVTFSFRVVPKTFTADTLAYIEVSNEGNIETFGPFAPQGNQTFTGEVTTAFTDDITLSVVFEDDGVRQTQLLAEYGGYWSATFPSVWPSGDLWRIDLTEPYVLEFPSKYHSGQIVNIPPHYLESGKQCADNEPAAEVAELKIGMFKNTELVAWAEPIPKPSNYHGFEGHLFFKFPELRVALTEEDTICVASVVTDTYGRTVFRHDTPLYAIEEGATLDYVDSSPYDDDIANWTFE